MDIEQRAQMNIAKIYDFTQKAIKNKNKQILEKDKIIMRQELENRNERTKNEYLYNKNIELNNELDLYKRKINQEESELDKICNEAIDNLLNITTEMAKEMEEELEKERKEYTIKANEEITEWFSNIKKIYRK